MSIISASELDTKKFEGFRLPGKWGDFLGFLEPQTTGFIWGAKGSGKSTWSLDLAKELAKYFGDEAVIYFSPEEGISRTMQDKIQRVGATRPNLYISDWYGMEHLKSLVTQQNAKAVFLDSAQMSRLSEREMEELHAWAKNQPIQLWIVNHATKAGKYKGSSMYAHMVDIELQVDEGTVTNEKNRCGGQGSMDVNFDSTLDRKSEKDNNQSTKRRRNPADGVPRENPVPVPFSTTLKELDKRHKIRHATRLNNLVNFKHGCFVRQNRAAQDQQLSFRYNRRQKDGKKVSILELLIDGTVSDEACENDFATAWDVILKNNGNLKIWIRDQKHAKTVLGAREYKKQEKAHKSKMKEALKDFNPPNATDIDKEYLPWGLNRYFNQKSDAVEIPLDKVLVKKKNPDKSIRNAHKFMRMAYDGQSAKRDPISVREHEGKYIVIDGNATTMAAKKAGWKSIMAIVESKRVSDKTPTIPTKARDARRVKELEAKVKKANETLDFKYDTGYGIEEADKALKAAQKELSDYLKSTSVKAAEASVVVKKPAPKPKPKPQPKPKPKPKEDFSSFDKAMAELKNTITEALAD